MRHATLFLATLALLLTGCSRQRHTTYHLRFNVEAAPIREELIISSLRLLESYAKRFETQLIDKQVTTGTGGTAAITIAVQDPKALLRITEELTKPFTLRFMVQAPDGEGDLFVEGYGSFRDTGIGERELFWAEAAEDDLTGKGAVRLRFTKEGASQLRTLVEENQGKTIGLFVRGLLISTLQTTQLKDDAVIRGIPSGERARSFADEVNVGLHVTFTLAS